MRPSYWENRLTLLSFLITFKSFFWRKNFTNLKFVFKLFSCVTLIHREACGEVHYVKNIKKKMFDYRGLGCWITGFWKPKYTEIRLKTTFLVWFLSCELFRELVHSVPSFTSSLKHILRLPLPQSSVVLLKCTLMLIT